MVKILDCNFRAFALGGKRLFDGPLQLKAGAVVEEDVIFVRRFVFQEATSGKYGQLVALLRRAAPVPVRTVDKRG